MIVSIGLLITEIFLLPGITIAGIGGALFGIAGIIFAYSISTQAGNITLISSGIAFGTTFFWLLRSNAFNRIALKTDIKSTVSSPRKTDLQVGDKGIALSRLAPIGKARFKNITVEAKSINEFIDEGSSVIVIKIEGYNVIVESIETT